MFRRLNSVASEVSRLLLDTCALIWWVNGDLGAPVEGQVLESGLEGELHVSSINAWEIGLLARRREPVFAPTAQSWFGKVLASPVVRFVPLSAQVAIAASELPGELHRDPADRLHVALARELDAALVTRDARLLSYAAQGHMRALAC